MDYDNNYLHIQKLQSTLDAAFSLLPIETSIIAYEIILITMRHYFMEEELSLKIIFSNKNFTEMGARYHLNRLIKNDWIISEKSEQDLRVRIIKPTDKLIEVFDRFQKNCFY